MDIPDRVSSINKESIEFDIGKEEPEEIRVGGIEVSQTLGTENIDSHPDSTLNSSSNKRGISAWLDRRAEKMARNRVKRIIEEPGKPTTIPRVCRVWWRYLKRRTALCAIIVELATEICVGLKEYL